MTKLDPFSLEIVRLVRNMSDEALLALVRNQLASPQAHAVAAVPSKLQTTSAKPAQKRSKATRGRRTSSKKQASLTVVERAVKASGGMSASQIAAKTGIPQARVGGLCRELKEAGRIHMAGSRRFARYAGAARTAQKASVSAHKSAKSPKAKKTRKSRKG